MKGKHRPPLHRQDSFINERWGKKKQPPDGSSRIVGAQSIGGDDLRQQLLSGICCAHFIKRRQASLQALNPIRLGDINRTIRYWFQNLIQFRDLNFKIVWRVHCMLGKSPQSIQIFGWRITRS